MAFMHKVVQPLTVILTLLLGFVIGQMAPTVHPVFSFDAVEQQESVSIHKAAPSSQFKKPTPNWLVRCREKQQGQSRRLCEMVQALTIQETGQTLIQVALTSGYSMQDDGEVIDMIGGLMMLPLGIQVEGGVILRIDEAEQARQFPIEECTEQGCPARVAFSSEDIAELSKAKILSVITRDQSGKAVVIPLSLEGFAEGLQEMKRKSYQ